MIQFNAFKKEFTQKGLASGDLSTRLLVHEIQITGEELHKLVDLPADTLLKVTIQHGQEERS